MTTSRELLKQVIVVLEMRVKDEPNWVEAEINVIEAIRAHLAKEPEPVTKIEYHDEVGRVIDVHLAVPLYRLEDM